MSKLDTDCLMDALLSLLAGLISHASPDPPGNETAIATYLHKELEAFGFNVIRDEFLPGRVNIIARLPGKGFSPGLVFSAHMDTMPIGDTRWQHPPFFPQIVGDKIYGRGSADMKSGIAAMIIAASCLKNEGLKLSGDLILAFSAGKSTDCIGAKRMVEIGALKDAGWLLISEPSSLRLINAETGALWLNVITRGSSGHSSALGGNNAIQKLITFCKKLSRLKLSSKPHPTLRFPSIAVNGLAAGNAPNMRPDYARATLDIRTLPSMKTDLIIEKLRAISDSSFSFEVIDEKLPIETEA
ncbi:MAG: hypothetical protein CBB68_00915 [Rhodospirillaceae bacterium TMED8]|nr:peptidase M20 [Magnetovibrio sp.]OUT53244.1 MAG: hypothetical protein CBB68_00915 [Rhodospirillaceae bacterium TMED8]|tara:strand:- start:3993 stop:4889 length:897 start_codon:yes stop_codon:yes gene_type:complete